MINSLDLKNNIVKFIQEIYEIKENKIYEISVEIRTVNNETFSKTKTLELEQ